MQLPQTPEEIAQMAGRLASTEWLLAHKYDFLPSEGNKNAMQAWIGKYEPNTPFSTELLDRAFAALKKLGWNFRIDNNGPANVPKALPTPRAERLAAEAPVPDWFPKIETSKDIRDLAHDKFVELYKGKCGHLFKARLEAVKRLDAEERG
jgi:hypothetical protein